MVWTAPRAWRRLPTRLPRSRLSWRWSECAEAALLLVSCNKGNGSGCDATIYRNWWVHRRPKLHRGWAKYRHLDPPSRSGRKMKFRLVKNEARARQAEPASHKRKRLI